MPELDLAINRLAADQEEIRARTSSIRSLREETFKTLSSLSNRAQCVAYHELKVARRWWSLPSGSPLPASNGATYTLLFAGLPGGTTGPDVRDAVFSVSYRPLLLLFNRRVCHCHR